MPHRIEVAKSGRARCRACKRSLPKDELRFAESVPNPVAEGQTNHFYHLECAAERRPAPFLEWLESEERDEGEPSRESVTNLIGLEQAARVSKRYRRLERLGVIQRAKSGRAKCRQCRATIQKDALRVALQPIEDGMMQSWGFVHVSCVPAYAETTPSLERLLRYSELDDATRRSVAAELAAGEAEAARADTAQAEAGPRETAEDERLEGDDP